MTDVSLVPEHRAQKAVQKALEAAGSIVPTSASREYPGLRTEDLLTIHVANAIRKHEKAVLEHAADRLRQEARACDSPTKGEGLCQAMFILKERAPETHTDESQNRIKPGSGTIEKSHDKPGDEETGYPKPGEKRGVIALRNAIATCNPAMKPLVNEVAEELLSGRRHVDVWLEEGHDV
jgi:hypothetical protein